MKTHDLVQGSQAWHAYRHAHFNASDAPAMLGVSPYKTRSQLLHELATGQVPAVDPATQRRFDAGHAAEAAARTVAEREIGEDLFPIVGSEGRLSASFDGLTMDDRIVWEHKLMNVDLADSLSRGIIPDQYHPQLEQQLMVSGAEKALFMATSPDRTAMECVWYTSRPDLRSHILQGWTQFAIDLENYVPVATEVKPVGRAPETLPALHIEVTGMVTASNLAAFKDHALAVFAGINRELVTDDQFADAEKTIKWAGEIESRLAAAKQHALSQTATIDDLFRTIDDISAEARRVRLELDKLVKARKEAIRTEIVMAAGKELWKHGDALKERIGRDLLPTLTADFAGAIKGKRTLDSMRDAVNTELARAKIEANAVADKITLNLRTLNEKPELAFLFSDVRELVLKEPEYIAMVVKNRIADHQAIEAARVEAERARIQAEEREKAEREAREKIAAEQAAFDKLEREEAARLAKLNTTMVLESAPAVTHDDVVKIMMPATVRQAMAPKVVAPLEGPPTLALGEISTRLGFNCTSAFLATLGFEATTVKAAKLFHESEFPQICQALIAHITEVSEQFDAVAA